MYPSWAFHRGLALVSGGYHSGVEVLGGLIRLDSVSEGDETEGKGLSRSRGATGEAQLSMQW